MPAGYNGKILRVDLTTGTKTVEEPSEEWYRTYIGGRGFNAYFLMKELKPGIDPLGPENKLIISLGPITGQPLAGSGRNSIGAKSPLTGGYGEGDVGGFFGAELKHAGFDAIIIEGVAERPTYLWVHDGECEIRDAGRVWGLATIPAQELLQEEVGDKRARVCQIGPAGENLVRNACILNDITHAAGRCGLGAVMGSKKLRAIVARGHKNPAPADIAVVREAARYYAQNFMKLNSSQYEYGTSGGVMALDAGGGLPTRNFQEGSFEDAEKICGQTMTATILVGRENCYACPINCKRVVKTGEPYNVNPEYGGPEYETIASLGSLLGIGDLEAIAKGNEICNAMGLDTIGVGTTIAFAMEAYERGLITKEDTGGIDLRFGNKEAALQMLEMITHRQGFGDVLAEGSLRAAKYIGKGAEEYVMHVKGQEFPMHEPRFKKALGVGYSLSPTGADHCHNMHDVVYTNPQSADVVETAAMWGVLGPVEHDGMDGKKTRLFTYHLMWRSLQNCVGLCQFAVWRPDRVTQLINAVTGWNSTLFELMKVGERMETLCRAFNIREGFTAADDSLPKRMFEPFADPKPTNTPLTREEWQRAKEKYYYLMGWDERGVPTKEKMEELDLAWADGLMREALAPIPR